MTIQKIHLPPFSRKILPTHHNVHYSHFRRYAELANIQVEYGENKLVWAPLVRVPNHFSMTVDGKQLIVDFSDKWEEGLKRFDRYPRYIKMQFNSEKCYPWLKLYPTMPPFHIQDDALITSFLCLCNEGIYQCNGDGILSNQRRHTRALERRTHVQNILKDSYGSSVDIELTDQWSFWQKFRKCLVSCVVPGANNNMLDRGHFEQLALGVCTVSPRLDTMLCHWKLLIPSTHYIQCKDDYSDLPDKIEWCRDHRQECREIGQNARQFFWNFLAPKPYWKWIEQIMEETT